MKIITAIILLLAASAAFATPVSMTRQEASNLHSALSSVQSGLSPVDTMTAADDINVLLPVALSLQKGQMAAQRQQALVVAGPEAAAKQLEILKPIEAKADEVVTLDLAPIDVTADEIKEAKITPSVLSVIRRFLAPVPPKK